MTGIAAGRGRLGPWRFACLCTAAAKQTAAYGRESLLEGMVPEAGRHFVTAGVLIPTLLWPISKRVFVDTQESNIP